jgi:hypothetical protein
MIENNNETPKRIVLVLSFEEYQQMIAERKQLPRNFKIAEKDKNKFIRNITKLI